jgi:preprotein translocase subunit SecD
VGCYVTARLAPSNPMKHAMILGVIGVFAAGAANYAVWGHVPNWFVIINVLLVLPLAWLGGRLRENEIAARA